MRKSLTSGGALAAVVVFVGPALAAPTVGVATAPPSAFPTAQAPSAAPSNLAPTTPSVPAPVPSTSLPNTALLNSVRTGAMTPQTIVLRPMSPAEIQANAIWSLRAGLNVAALQCQFSPYLATVRTYNDLLKHHSAELAKAQATMIAHFKRYDKARALNSFDEYSTRMYNSYSTLDAQYSFCAAAATNGRPALLLNKGGLGTYALVATPALRASLTPAVAASAPTLDGLVPMELSEAAE